MSNTTLRTRIVAISLLTLATACLAAVLTYISNNEQRSRDVEYIRTLARTFVSNNIAAPDRFGTHVINSTDVVCRTRIATPADNMANIISLNGLPECLAAVVFTETYTTEEELCIDNYFETRIFTAPSEGETCPAVMSGATRHEHRAHLGESVTKHVVLTFVNVDGVWKYFPHAIVINPSSSQRQYIAYRTR